MITAGVVIDRWKLPHFERIFDREGFQYIKTPGIARDTLLLRVQTASAAELHPFVVEANQAAARSKMN